MNKCGHVYPKHYLILSAVFYYTVLFILLVSGLTLGYWQIEKDPAQFSYKMAHVELEKNTKDFLVDLDFCPNKKTRLTVEKHYYDKNKKIFYSIPAGQYSTDKMNCLKTKIHAHTGNLERGSYEYRVDVVYELNPLREIRQELALITVEVK